jgi:RNA polymerase sigma-70 factor (ECF subfamily)
MPGREQSDAAGRAVTYCVIPRELAPHLHEVLRRHFREFPGVEVVVEQRERERRRRGERRGKTATLAEHDARRIRAASGRRIADRRATAVPTLALPLPRRAAPYAELLQFIERLEPASIALEDRDTAALVTRFQSGDREAFAALYLRYFERLFGYLMLVLRDRDDAENAAQEIFSNVLYALPRYERREQPFRAWLFRIARNEALRQLRRRARSEPVDPSTIEIGCEEAVDVEVSADVLGWISDPELLLFIERLPLAQRQVLVLRYLLDLPTSEIARLLERSNDDIRALQSRALRFLRYRLSALGRGPVRRSPRSRMSGRRDMRLVLRARRFALVRR